ncbi:hypothetical protein [Mycolicibacterium houstonense]|uniref:hypothetical protein n=1 Tax=Mycolicibacterium houstonense TaxID=146021 RepID=UPI003F94EFC9
MFDPAEWGTVADWTGATLTGFSVLAAVVYYVYDRERQRRAQAGSVLVWLHPYEHGPPELKMKNLSDKPVFDHGFLITSRPRKRIAKAARDGWKQNPMFAWPDNDTFTFSDKHTLLNFHDGSELYLSPNKQAAYHPQLGFNSAVYDFYAYFRDVSGQYWVIDARTQRPVSAWKRRKLDIGPAGLDAS